MKNKWIKIINRIKGSKFIQSFFLNVIFLLLVLIFCDIKYEVSDDFIMEILLSGAYGGGVNPFLLYSNIIWGYLLTFFYTFWGEVGWYCILQIAVCFWAYTAITYVVIEKIKGGYGIMLSLILISFFSNDTYIVVQFTKTAVLAIMGGSVLFLHGVFETRVKMHMIAGGLLVVVGSMIRSNTIWIGGVFVGVLLFVHIFHYFHNKIGTIYQFCCKIAFPGVALIASVFVVYGINVLAWSNSEYKEYLRFNQARAKIIDYPHYGYKTNETQYKALGLSENDFEVLVHWNFEDPTKYTPELLEEVKSVIEQYREDNVEVSKREVVRQMRLRGYEKYIVFWACMLLLLCCAIFRIRALPYVVFIGGCGAVVLFYFFYIGRVVYRVEYSVFLAAFVAALYCVALQGYGKQNNVQKKLIYAIMICIIMSKIPMYIPDNQYNELTDVGYRTYVEEVFFASWNYNVSRYRCNIPNKTVQSDLLDEIERNKNNFYFLDFATTIQNIYLDYNPLNSLGANHYENVSYFSGVTTNYPSVKEFLKKNKLQNPMEALCEKRVYIVDNNNIDLKLAYVREHFYPNAQKELYKEVDGYKIWKFTKE